MGISEPISVPLIPFLPKCTGLNWRAGEMVGGRSRFHWTKVPSDEEFTRLDGMTMADYLRRETGSIPNHCAGT